MKRDQLFGLSPWLGERVPLPRWIVLLLFLLSGFNGIIFFALVSAFWRPDSVPVPITGDVVLGLHLQLFEAFLAALAIGLAVFGLIGFATLREAAERRAEESAREVAQRFMDETRASGPASSQAPDLAGLPEDVQAGKREPEEGGI